MAGHDLVIRNGSVVDGTGTRAAVVADVGVDGGRITEIGEVATAGRREIDADGLVVAPGWVDIHAHYDAQATWDPEVTPSSWHGVTTAVIGSCGLGVAPVRPGTEEMLVELLDGAKRQTAAVLRAGVDWRWESFGEYLDVLDATPRVLDLAAQVPHSAIRTYVLGDRAYGPATPDEIAQMAFLLEDALAAGAIGFSTSRTTLHRTGRGLVPGSTASPNELFAFADIIGTAGHGVVEMIADHVTADAERELLTGIASRTNQPVTYALGQVAIDAHGWKRALGIATDDADAGFPLVPQVTVRPTGLLFGLQSILHPFMQHPTYQGLRRLPLAEQVARLQDPGVRASLLSEQPDARDMIVLALMSQWHQIFPLGDPPDYEPDPSSSVAAVADRDRRLREEVALDWLLERDGTALLFAPLSGYVQGDHEALRAMISHPATVVGQSNSGAHWQLICDSSMPTSLLTHWVRDRTRGPRLPLEQAVHLQSGRPARLYGLADRGTIALGKRADLNLVDLDGLRLHAPVMVRDLPAGGQRFVQRVDGYRATIVAGAVTFERGEPTGACPGRVVRAGRRSSPTDSRS
jgi:N-acyl-D-aspartate/D-glutamate deacylase